DEVINLFINVFLTIPAIPLLVVISTSIGTQGIGTMIFVVALVLSAFDSRILRGPALSLAILDFVGAAKVSGAPTWRLRVGELAGIDEVSNPRLRAERDAREGSRFGRVFGRSQTLEAEEA